MNNQNPPRLFVLVPQHAHQAVIIVRKRAKLTGLFAWDTHSDDISVSQWLKGRIYEYVSDISPDAKYLIYSANKKGMGYTVISRAPWLKAISLWHNFGCYGGGVFLQDQQYQFFESHEACCEFHKSPMMPNPSPLTVYPERLVRLGWRIIQSEKESVVFERNFGDYTIEKTLRDTYNRVFGYVGVFEVNRLINSTGSTACPDWEWCDVVGERLIWAAKGCLFSTSLEAFNIDKPHLIFDFNVVSFEEREAPY